MQFGPMCELATTPGKTSEMLKILKHMGVTAYGPRQRGNLQNPLPLFLTFSAEEKWWTKYASSEVPASNKPWAAVRRSQDKCKRYHMFWHWHGLDKCLLCTGNMANKNAETISWRFLPSKPAKYILRMQTAGSRHQVPTQCFPTVSLYHMYCQV